MKVTGAEFMEWYDDHFPEGHYFDPGDADAIETHGNEGEWLLDPAATYATDELGEVYLEDPNSKIAETNMDASIRAYRRKRDGDILVITVPKAKTAEVKALLKAHGVKFA